jgi:hypothetical protein
MYLVLFWILFVIVMSIGALGEIDTFHYILNGFSMFYITYVYDKLKNS